MTCEACDLTRARQGYCGLYVMDCNGCVARGIARSLAAFQALEQEPRDPQYLREAIARLFPQTPYADARRAVWEWWNLDHEKQGATL